MKKHFKGFTLIECLIALAILGVASLTMAQIYASVAQRNRNNQIMNTSLSNQMSYVERYTSSQTVPIYYGNYYDTSNNKPKPDPEANKTSTTKLPPHRKSTSTNCNYVKITKVKDGKDPLDSTFVASDRVSDSTYSFPVDVYVLLSRDNNDVNSSGKDANSDSKSFSGQYEDLLENSDPNKKYEDDMNLRYRYLLGHVS